MRVNEGRNLAGTSVEASQECATAQAIRDYLKDKTIVVYATQSFVREDEENATNEVITILEPVAEKRLDFKYHKRMEAVI